MLSKISYLLQKYYFYSIIEQKSPKI